MKKIRISVVLCVSAAVFCVAGVQQRHQKQWEVEQAVESYTITSSIGGTKGDLAKSVAGFTQRMSHADMYKQEKDLRERGFEPFSATQIVEPGDGSEMHYSTVVTTVWYRKEI